MGFGFIEGVKRVRPLWVANSRCFASRDVKWLPVHCPLMREAQGKRFRNEVVH